MPQQPAAKLRKGGTGTAQRGGPHHAPIVCFLCNKGGHLARDCPDRGTGGTHKTKAFGMGMSTTSTAYVPSCVEVRYAYGCCEGHSSGSGDQTLPTACPAGTTGEQPSGIFGAFDYDDYLLSQYHDYAPDYVDEFDAAEGAVEALGIGKRATHNHHYGILDGGATSTCASFEIVQLIADAWEPLDRHPDV